MHDIFLFLYYMQFRTIQGDCWLYSNNRLIGRCNIVKLFLLLDFYYIFFVLLFFLFMIEIFISHKYRRKYLVIISSYQARAYELQVDSRDHPIFVSEVGL